MSKLINVTENGIETKVCECLACGSLHDIDEMHMVDDDENIMLCDDCFERIEEPVVCCDCGKVFDRKDLYEVDGSYGDMICDDCLEYGRNYFRCDSCGEIHPQDEMTYIDGEWYCEDCRDEDFFRCEDCGEWVSNVDGTYMENLDKYVCDACLENYVRCERCGDWVRRGDATDVITSNGTEVWCDSCCDNWAVECADCGDMVDVDFAEYSDEGYYYCPDCYEEYHSCQDTGDINTFVPPKGIASHDFKPAPCFCPAPDEDTVFFGVELETEQDYHEHCYDSVSLDGHADKINDILGFSYCKHDGSLHQGIEIVTHPATLDYFTENRDKFIKCFNYLKEHKFTSHDNGDCGLHVHLSLDPFEANNPLAVCNVLYLFSQYWDKIVRFSRRTESQLDQWARRYSAKLGDLHMLKSMAKCVHNRYMAVNLQNTHTVEIRVFRGSLNIETFYATLQFMHNLVQICMNSKTAEEIQRVTWEDIITRNDFSELQNYCSRRFNSNN